MEFDSKLLTVVSAWITDRPPIRHGLSVRQILILLMLFQYLRVKRCLTENLIGWKGWGKSETLERGRKKVQNVSQHLIETVVFIGFHRP